MHHRRRFRTNRAVVAGAFFALLSWPAMAFALPVNTCVLDGGRPAYGTCTSNETCQSVDLSSPTSVCCEGLDHCTDEVVSNTAEQAAFFRNCLSSSSEVWTRVGSCNADGHCS